MLKLILALVLSMATLALPAQALCLSDSAPAQMDCCCGGESSDCAEVGDTCCAVSNEVPALPEAPLPDVNVAPAATSAARAIWTKHWAIPAKVAFTAERHKPLHLASNKVYLFKRTLLI